MPRSNDQAAGPLLKAGDRGRIEVDSASATASLRRTLQNLATLSGPLAGKRHSLSFEVEVRPSESYQLTTPRTRHQSEAPQSEETIVADVAQEVGYLTLRPDVVLRTVGGLGRLVSPVGRIAGYEPVLDRFLKRPVKSDVDVVNGHLRQRTLFPNPSRFGEVDVCLPDRGPVKSL